MIRFLEKEAWMMSINNAFDAQVFTPEWRYDLGKNGK